MTLRSRSYWWFIQRVREMIPPPFTAEQIKRRQRDKDMEPLFAAWYEQQAQMLSMGDPLIALKGIAR